MNLKQLNRKKTVQQVLANANAGQDTHSKGLAKHLGVRDLTAFGIAAIIGAGIFATIGKASAMGGPAVILLFIGTAIACSFAALAYAEFASLVPVSGSAYTYSYVAFGELFAWIIGWALIMEYAIGNITVAISWSDYFTSLINNTTPYHFPEWLSMDYLTASSAFDEVSKALSSGLNMEQITSNLDLKNYIDGYTAWSNAPTIGGFHIIFDLPALAINVLITWLVYRGIKESRNASNLMVLIKLIVVILVICVGAFYIDTSNWSPFSPNGITGILAGVSSVFFAYIGFDAISTTAEECKNPQHDLPRGILYSIVICTVLYVAIALVITGIVNYKELNVPDPLAYVFEKIHELRWLSNIIAISAVVALASVLLVFQLGQPRIWLTMSRDGLLPKKFSTVHPKYKTPSYATILTGFIVGVPIFFVDMNVVVDVCSLGTLFAFALVCAGVLQLEEDRKKPGHNLPDSKFKIPYVNAKYIIPALFVLSFVLLGVYSRPWLKDFFSFSEWSVVKENIPMYVFFLLFAWMSYRSFLRNYSLIPVLGLLSCMYMISQLGFKNWMLFIIWLIIGLIIYFSYSIKNSKLKQS